MLNFLKSSRHLSKQLLFRILPYRRDPFDHDRIETMYLSHGYEHWKGIAELARYSVVAGYCHFCKPGGAVLDVGCGEGILHSRLDASKYVRYVGIDFAAPAIERASLNQDDKAVFIHADAANFTPQEKFDVIVFGECLYHFDDPLSIVRRYERFLDGDGLFIVSICNDASTARIWKMLAANYAEVDHAVVSGSSRFAWTIKVFRPAPSPTARAL
jgi:2-polyprenyl-6-hydroxyphenyl methylase/3-demethylubiquinone-9 3-methyltransferase